MQVCRVTDPAQATQSYPCTIAGTHFWADGLGLSREWFAEKLGQYVEGLHLEDDSGQVIGHIYWAESEWALAPYRFEGGSFFRPRRHEGTKKTENLSVLVSLW